MPLHNRTSPPTSARSAEMAATMSLTRTPYGRTFTLACKVIVMMSVLDNT